ncbi:DUF3035 domain-containing protein [Candidatus Pelagibacter sp.]|nr:DUF3035 domain-containing protein [Candidatus Pelagibacter sp.]
MKNLFKNTLFTLLILGALSGCQSVQDGLTGKKQTNSDEFLVKKKNPLSLPPDFENLPEPTTSNKNDDKNDTEISLKEILTKNANSKSIVSVSETSIGSLEKNILEKIKSN